MQSPYPDLPAVSSSRLVPDFSTTQPATTVSILDTNLINETTTSQPIVSERSDNITGIFYISKSDDPTQFLNTSSSEETTNLDDAAYIIPIKVILHAEHVHRDPNNNETFLKFNYILMQTNDTSYHGHFESDDSAERLTPLKNVNETNAQLNDTNVDNVTDESISTTSVSPISVLVNKDGDQYDQINEQIIVNDDGVITNRFNEIAWKRQNVESQISPPNVIIENKEITGDRAMSSESDQENDKHYSQILQWIHFSL